ncbi:DUF3500 domain-containing protein [Agromyces sp. SYSU T00194]|uniref:DUF3500 domain-containing protein n=1 Tax=Agromyces chitinivorans TaxID=3158560 RepID=UPI00339078E9
MNTSPAAARPATPLRRWIGASSALVLAVTLAACSSTDETTSESTASESSSSSSSSTASSSDVVALAEAFAATLSDDQQAELFQEYTFENAANWSNLPDALLSGGPGGGSGGGRVGLQTDSLSDEQWAALEDLLAAVTGSGEDEGFDEILQHLAADDYLGDNGGGSDYGAGNYFIAFLGTPSDSGTWELQFGGHHLAVANTYVDGALAGATPSFRGIEPFQTVEQDGETVQPEQQEQAAFAALLASLNDDQLAAAELSTSYNDILLGPGNDWAFPETSEGLVGSELTDEQQDLLLAAIATYVDDVDDADAATILAEYESELDETYLAFSGTTGVDQQGDYIRIDGPSVWIEFSMQNGIVLSGAHPHAVWRDKQNDYGGTTS